MDPRLILMLGFAICGAILSTGLAIRLSVTYVTRGRLILSIVLAVILYLTVKACVTSLTLLGS